jgi:nicotinate-nucleotide adenylyltransferase
MPQPVDGRDAAEDLPILVCPLEHERRALLATGIDPQLVETCGPGREGVRRWADRHPQLRRPVILTGLAGGLDPDLASGDVVVAGEIIDAHGRVTSPPLTDQLGLQVPIVRIATAGRLVASPEAKLALARATNAAVVDLETSHFADIARARDWRWGVIRVVGDAADEAIPTALERFVDHLGRTRMRVVAGEVFRRPALLPILRRLNAASRTALTNLGKTLGTLAPIPSTMPTTPSTSSRPSTSTPDAGPAVTLVFGGTFDPPHRGHLRLSFEAARRLGCREIVFVPARVSPLKQDTPPTSPEIRVRMLEAAIEGFRSRGGGRGITSRISRLEVDRPGASYMIDTLRALHLELIAEAGEDASDPRRRPRMRLLIGSDQALDFTQWRDWRAIVDLAPPVVMPRPPATRTSLAALYRARFPKDLASRWSTWTLDLPTDGVSSTTVRERLERGEDVDELLAPEVRAIIESEGLYGTS